MSALFTMPYSMCVEWRNRLCYGFNFGKSDVNQMQVSYWVVCSSVLLESRPIDVNEHGGHHVC